ADAVPDIQVLGYGFGLFVVDDARFGRVVGHGGGYPGFGTNMRWHHASGLGLITLTNHRYGPGAPMVGDLLAELLKAEAAPIRRVRPNTATQDAQSAVEALIDDWDNARAADLFAMNVELDEPVAVRRATIDRIRERHGALRRDETEPIESQSPFHLGWWMTGSRGGRVRIELLLTPQLPPRVQTFSITSVPEPSARLHDAAAIILAALQPPDGPGPISIDWPASLSAAAAVDLGAVVRSMRATEARFGPVRLGPPIAGDGATKATFRLESPRGRVDLVLELDPAIDCLSSIALVPARLAPPDFD
ncbi:MAG: hypothetical protein ABIZ52_06990, partial [Candidatus Limnocylindrales bacterium]